MILFHYITCSPFFFLWDYDIFIISSVTFSTQIFHVIFFIYCLSFTCLQNRIKKNPSDNTRVVCCSFIFLIYPRWNYQNVFFLLEKLMNVFLTLISNYLCFFYIYLFLLLLIFIGLRSWSKNNFFCLW
jgi:hypothetical protein